MSLTPPKRLFHVPSMSTVFYKDNADDVKEKGYFCVSHVWGEQKLYTAQRLYIKNGIDWKIPLSNPRKMDMLLDAMIYFKKEYCWMDVLCMPQDKQDEINLEIPLMGDYYSIASTTLFLSDNFYDVSEDFREWYRLMEDIVDKDRQLTTTERDWIMSGKSFPKLHLDKWFYRVWTLQETMLSNNIMMVSKDGNFINITQTLKAIGILSTRMLIGYKKLFGGDDNTLANLGLDILKYKGGDMDLRTIMASINTRLCYKDLDRFYGVLGILGYKDFVVDYDMNIEDLNRAMARYAYSKGDVSWMAVEGNYKLGFIQPMYGLFQYVSAGGKETRNSVYIDDNIIGLRCVTLGNVVNLSRFDRRETPKDYVIENLRTFTQWGFSNEEIIEAIGVPENSSDAYKKVATNFVDMSRIGLMFRYMYNIWPGLLNRDDEAHYANILTGILSMASDWRKETHVKVESRTLNKNFLLGISGEVNIGDEVVILEGQNHIGNRLGLVVSGIHRKGVCVIRKAIPIDIRSSHTRRLPL